MPWAESVEQEAEQIWEEWRSEESTTWEANPTEHFESDISTKSELFPEILSRKCRKHARFLFPKLNKMD